MAVIYKVTNKINGKIYIGYATNFKKRKSIHRYNYLNENENTSYLHKSMKKHGWENFEWEIILENATLDDEIRLIEEYQSFHTTGKGYNLTKGGDGNLGWIMQDDTKDKISKKAKGNKNCLGRILSENTKEKISKKIKQIGIDKKELKYKQIAESLLEVLYMITESIEKPKRKCDEKQLEVLRKNSQKMKETGHNENVRQIISKKLKEKYAVEGFSEEHRNNISKNHASKKETGSFYKSDEYREKMRKSLTGKKRSPESIERYRLAAKKREEKKKLMKEQG